MRPFHVFEQNFLAAAVIEFRGLAVGVPGEHSCTLDRSPNSMIPLHRPYMVDDAGYEKEVVVNVTADPTSSDQARPA